MERLVPVRLHEELIDRIGYLLAAHQAKPHRPQPQGPLLTLLDPAVQSMEVRLLINKRQLDSLTVVLNDVMAAGRRGQIGGEDFFSALQATAATAAREPDQIRNAKTMAQTGLIPEFLQGLPYTSRLMDMTNELWASWGVDEQDEFLNDLEAKVDSYRAIHDRPEAWIALNQGDDPDDHVHPVSLELLP